MSWIQGGPFLEVSFIVSRSGSRQEQVIYLLDKLNSLKVSIQFVNFDIDSTIDHFIEGETYDETGSETIRIHSLQINIMVCIARLRKGIIYVEELADETFLINFCFYGSELDATEWNQVGVRKDEIPDFVILLSDLFSIYDFIIGGISYEKDIKDVYNSEKPWPNIDYHYKNININSMLATMTEFNCILWNQKIEKINPRLCPMMKHESINDTGILFTFEE